MAKKINPEKILIKALREYGYVSEEKLLQATAIYFNQSRGKNS